MERKCPICKSNKTKGPKYSDYCRKCGLFLGEIKEEEEEKSPKLNPL